MYKKIIKRNLLFFILAIGVILMSNILGCNNGFKYLQYASKDPALNISLDYISGWSYREHRGDGKNYDAGVIFIEDKKGRILKAFISVYVQDALKTGFVSPTLEAMVDDLVAKRLKLEDTKVLKKSKIKLLSTAAWEILFASKALDKIYSLDAKFIPIQERVVIFQKGDKFYVIRYQNREEEFSRYDKAFTHIIHTLKFKRE